MSNHHNGPGWHLSLATANEPRFRKLTKREQAERDKQSAALERWIEKNWVPCVKCGTQHPPQHGSHCIVCAVHTPDNEQRSAWRIGPNPKKTA